MHRRIGDAKFFTADLSRQPAAMTKKSFGFHFGVDALPSCTTASWYLAVFANPISPQNIKVAQKGRFLTVRERAAVFGFKYDLLRNYLTERQTSSALGNSIPPLVAKMVLAPVLEYLSKVAVAATASIGKTMSEMPRVTRKMSLSTESPRPVKPATKKRLSSKTPSP